MEADAKPTEPPANTVAGKRLAPAPANEPAAPTASPSAQWYLALGQWYTAPRTTAPSG